MPFDITQFKSAMNRFGGPARSSLFEVTVTPYKDGSIGKNKAFGTREFSFFCKTVNMPGIIFNTAENAQVGQLPTAMPTGISARPLETIFMCDSDHQVLSFFHQWAQNVMNYGTKGGPFAQIDNKLPFEIGYRDEYACRVTVRHYSTESFQNKYYEVILDKCYPTIVGDLDLSWENNDSYLTLPVSFNYKRIEYSGEKTGSPTSRLNRGNGILDILGAVAGFADVVRQTTRGGKPTSIQDAVNRVTRVTNSFDNISNTLGI